MSSSSFTLKLSRGSIETPLRLDLAIVEAAMLWPDDPASRERWQRAAEIEELLPVSEKVDDPELLRTLIGKIQKTKHLEDIQPAPERVAHGVLVGRFLRDIVAQYQIEGIGRPVRPIAEALINQVLRSVRDAQRSKETLKHASDFRMSWKTFDNRVWPRFRSVAHFWAASHTLKVDLGVSSAFPCSIDCFADFLSAAESYRKLGEQIRAKQARDPVLRPGEAVRLPAELIVAEYPLRFKRRQ